MLGGLAGSFSWPNVCEESVGGVVGNDVNFISDFGTETRVAHGKPDWVNWLSRLEERSSADLEGGSDLIAYHSAGNTMMPRGRLYGI